MSSERITVGRTHKWDLYLKAVSVVMTCAVFPAVGWAFKVHGHLAELSMQMDNLSSQIQSDRSGTQALLIELREMRKEIAAMKTDLVQRITRVETQLEKR